MGHTKFESLPFLKNLFDGLTSLALELESGGGIAKVAKIRAADYDIPHHNLCTDMQRRPVP